MKVDFDGYYNAVFCFSQEELRLLRTQAEKAHYRRGDNKNTLDFGDFKIIEYYLGGDSHRYFIVIEGDSKEFKITPTQHTTMNVIFMKLYHNYYRERFKSEIDKTCKAVGRWKYNLEKENKSIENNA